MKKDKVYYFKRKETSPKYYMTFLLVVQGTPGVIYRDEYGHEFIHGDGSMRKELDKIRTELMYDEVFVSTTGRDNVYETLYF